MKKIIYLSIVVFLTSCGTQNPNYSSYQNRNLRKFSNNKIYGRNVTPRKNGSFNDPTVKKETRRALGNR